MLRSVKELMGYAIRATDGIIGSVKDFYFDDEDWMIRYFVVDTGTWLPGREVLLVPNVFHSPEWEAKVFPVTLSKEQIKESPPIEEDQPVSRQNEIQLHEYFDWIPYWTPVAAGYSGMAAPVPPPERKQEAAAEKSDKHLRSVKEVTGYHIKAKAKDGEIGHADDFITEDDNWVLRYMVVDTKKWLPGKRVLVAPDWIDDIDWEERRVVVDMAREKIKDSPEFDPTTPINKEYEARLYDYYGRPKYWMEE